MKYIILFKIDGIWMPFNGKIAVIGDTSRAKRYYTPEDAEAESCEVRDFEEYRIKRVKK